MARSNFSSSKEISDSQQQHIPAWRRIGLKLKYAKDVADSSERHDTTDNQSKTSIHSASTSKVREAIEDGRQRKRRRVDQSSSPPSVVSNGSHPPTLPIEEGETNRKKRVTFSPGAADNSPPLKAPKTATDPKDTSKRFSNQSQHQGSHNSSQPSHQKLHASLAYLVDFSTSRQTWKFYKSKEIWLLKNALSVELIPTSYSFPLSHYIKSLKGDSARFRLRATAEEAILKDKGIYFKHSPTENDEATEYAGKIKSTPMDDPVACQKAYEGAVARYRRRIEQCLEAEDSEMDAEDPELRKRLVKRKRAELILWSLGPSKEADNLIKTQHPNDRIQDDVLEVPSSTKRNETTTTVKQKRKIRVANVIDMSSSSGESSDASDQDGGGNNGRDLRSSSDIAEGSSHSSTESSSGSTEYDSASSESMDDGSIEESTSADGETDSISMSS